MARKSYPVSFEAELRGVVPPMSFRDKETGELVNLAAAGQFEAVNEDGSVELHQVRMDPERLTTTLKAADFVRGMRVRVAGDAVISDTGSSYFRYLSVEAA